MEYLERNGVGDHIFYIAYLGRCKADYPRWSSPRGMTRGEHRPSLDRLETEGVAYEIVAINDASSDATLEEVHAQCIKVAG